MCAVHVAMLAKVNHLQIIICSSWCVFVDDNIVVIEQQKTKSKKIKVPKYFKMESEILKHYFKYVFFFYYNHSDQVSSSLVFNLVTQSKYI